LQMKNNKSRFLSILLAGTLSMFFAEVFAGSSQLWFIDAWSLLITFPLYLFHLLFFLNVAFRTGKTSVPQLYLWGVLFALYESWITKVIWSGFGGNGETMMGTFMGIAVSESLLITFYWHPVHAFVLPVLVFQLLGNTEDIISGHKPFMVKNKKTLFWLMFPVFFGSLLLSLNTQYNLEISLPASLVTILIIYLLSKKADLSIHSLKLTNKGLIVVAIYLALLYIIAFFLLKFESVPRDPLPILIVIAFYVLVIVILKISTPSKDEETKGPYFGRDDFYKYILLLPLLLIILSPVPEVAKIATGILLYAVSFSAPVLFIIITKKAIEKNE